MEDRSWRSSRGRRLLLPRRQEMRMTVKRYGDCSALSTKTVCCSKTHVHTMLTHATESGELTEAELRTALVNGDWTPFDPHTVRMMIRMFDTNRSGSVNFDEFWYLALSFSRPVQANTLFVVGSGASSRPGAACSTVSTKTIPAAYPTLNSTKPSLLSDTASPKRSSHSCTARTIATDATH